MYVDNVDLYGHKQTKQFLKDNYRQENLRQDNFRQENSSQDIDKTKDNSRQDINKTIWVIFKKFKTNDKSFYNVYIFNKNFKNFEYY